jgi:lipoate-protein ligase A
LPLHPESTWHEVHVRTTASEQHGRDLPAERSVWNVDITTPAIVLGSRQTEAELDLDACVIAETEIVRRRSGGGMVYLLPGKQVWLDVVIPKDDRLWIDDVGRAAWWLGDVWLAAIKSLATAEKIDAYVHRQDLVRGKYGDLVCFSGAGPGEVMTLDDAGNSAKIVGISQRRTQNLARFQCTMYLQWESVLSQQFGRLLSDPSAALVEMQSNLEHSVMPLSKVASGSTASDVMAAFMAQITRV